MKHLVWGQMTRWGLGLVVAGLAAFPMAGCDDGGGGGTTTDDMNVGGMGGGAGGMGGGAGGEGGMGGGMGGMGGGMGGAGGMMGGECGASTVIDFAADASQDGSTWTLSGRTDPADNNSGSCGGEDAGADVVVKFTAPEAGFWVFTTAGTGFDTLLYALRDCNSGFTEVACNDDAAEGEPTSRIALELNAGDTMFLVVDALSGVAANDFTLTAEAIEANAPSVDTVELALDRLRGGLGIRIMGGDADNDATSYAINFLGADGMPIAELATTFDDPDLADVVTFNQADGMFSFELTGYFNPDLIAATAAIEVTVIDSLGLQNDPPVTAQPIEPAVAARGEACDEIFTGCDAADACDFDDEGNGSCVEANPPVITGATGFINAEAGLIGVVIEGTDAENNAAYALIQPLDAEGNPINISQEDVVEPVAAGFDSSVPGEGENSFTARAAVFNLRLDVCLGPAQASFDACAEAGGDQNTCIEEANALLESCSIERIADVASLQVWAGDETLKESAEPFVIEMVAPTPTVEAGAACDGAAATAICPDMNYCYSLNPAEEAPACGEAVTECPADWAPIDLNMFEMGNGYLYEGDSSEAVNRVGQGSCGGGGAQDVLQFTAPRAGTWQFVTTAAAMDGDTLLIARTHCALPQAEFEAACNDDIDTQGGNYNSIVQVELEADQAIYLFVDGYNGGFAGAYSLQVSQAN